MAYASRETLLSLDRYSQIMGIQPLAFNGAVSNVIFPSAPACSDVWRQYAWQNADQVSREDLALAINSAENDLARVLGYWPAPKWIETEVRRYPQFHRPEYFGVGMRNVRGARKSVTLKWGKFIQGGQRQSDLQGVIAPAFSTPDGDTFDETVTITLAGIDSDAELCEVKVYHVGHDGDPEYEIRPARTESLVTNTYTATFWAWQFFKPSLLEELPLSDSTAINADLASSYVTSVEVRWTYNDYAQSHGTIFWRNDPTERLCCTTCSGSGCPACAFTTQSACIHSAAGTDQGLVAVTPATYDTDDEQWVTASPSMCRDPSEVTLNYYAGEQSDRYLADYTCDPLERYLAEAIAWIATARLERPYCACGAITALNTDLRRDMSIVGTSDGTSWFAGEVVNENPFGTRLGEVKAWLRIDRMVESVATGVAL